MAKFKLKPSRKIGQLLSIMREEQLQGRMGKEKSLKERKKKAYRLLKKHL